MNTVRTFVMEGGVWAAKRVPKGHRKPEWNRENEKMAAKISRRQRAYDNMVSAPGFKGNKDGYHRPGSAKKR